MKLGRAIIMFLFGVWFAYTCGKIVTGLHAQATAVEHQAAALNRLAAAQEAETELTRRYYHALDDAEGER